MTKEEFYQQINRSRFPKYTFSQIKEGIPDHDCVALICTSSDHVIIGKYENDKWRQVCFTSTKNGQRQEIYYVDIESDVIYWTDGPAEDTSRAQRDE